MQNLTSLKKNDLDLIEKAKKHIKKMYQVDRTSIAAVLQTKNGNIFTGVNLKYQARGVSMCGARVAMFSALDAGQEEFSTLVEVKFFPETDEYQIVNNCGECRQVFLYYPPFDVILDDQSRIRKISTKELLPFSYV